MNPGQQIIPPVVVDQTRMPQRKTYYSRLDGCTYIFPNGHIARFENAMYVTDKKGEIEELDSILHLPGQYMYSDKPLEVQRSDAKVLRELGSANNSGVRQSASGTGTLNSQMLGGAAAPSGR